MNTRRDRPAPAPRWMRWLTVLSVVAALAGAVVHVAFGYSGGTTTSEHAWGADDAYISYRYAANLIAGQGLVFNPGERVEGFTNLLFVGLCALVLCFVDADLVYLPVSALNLAFLALVMALVYRRSVEQFGVRRAALASWLLALCPVLWLWTASGMETVLVVALQVGLWGVVERAESCGGRRELAALALVLSLLVLARADGFVWVVVTVAYFILHGRLALALGAAAAAAPSLLLLFAWRFAYYGELLPNTYYAKLSEPLGRRLLHGGEQLLDLAFATGLVPYLLALLFLALETVLAGRGGERLRLPFPAFFAGSLVGYWLYVGGDHYAERFLLVLFPLGIAAFLREFGGLAAPRLAFLAVLLLLFQLRPLVEDPRFAYRRGAYDCWITLGEFLGDAAAEDALLAVDAAGKIPYFSGLRTVDMRGLTDRHIARVEPQGFESPGHNKSDPAYVLALRPDLISAWMMPDLGLILGLDRDLYRQAGYRLMWLLNTTREYRRWNVVDVSAATDAEIRDLIGRGYRYGVLTRAAP